jgi:hypothetical protein
MGLIYVSDDTWFTSPHNQGFVGAIRCEGVKEDKPAVLDRALNVRENSFALSLRIKRCGGTIEQQVAVFSMPSSPVLYLERLVALKDVTISEVLTGSIGLLNENRDGITPNTRTVRRAGGEAVITGESKEPASWLHWKTTWANVDNRLGVIGTTGAMAYYDNNSYVHARLEELLVPNHRENIGQVAKGSEIGVCAVAYVPNQRSAETASSRLEVASVSRAVVAARFNGQTVVVNFGRKPAVQEVFGHRVTLKPMEAVIVGN